MVCLPGGPGRHADYLGDRGGLGQRAECELIILEPRGTGASPVPPDPATYRDPAWFTTALAGFLARRLAATLDTCQLGAGGAGEV